MSTGSPDRGLYDVRWQPIADGGFAEKPIEPESRTASALQTVAFWMCLLGFECLWDAYTHLQIVLQDARPDRHLDASRDFQTGLAGLGLVVVGSAIFGYLLGRALTKVKRQRLSRCGGARASTH